ncbi:hypothetical protein NC652_037854 [Populus alba x Populus x berolinensis]|nr:hypothetical protein NC652_037854 [Populus alba x Populus x berolinensis]
MFDGVVGCHTPNTCRLYMMFPLELRTSMKGLLIFTDVMKVSVLAKLLLRSSETRVAGMNNITVAQCCELAGERSGKRVLIGRISLPAVR